MQGDHAAIGMSDHVDTGWRGRQQRLQQPEFVVHPEAMTVRPGIGSAIANEIRSDHAKPGLQGVDHWDPHDRRAGGAVQQQRGGTRPGRQAGAAQDWRVGSHVHFHTEFMPGERGLPIDRISSRSIELHGSRQFSAGVDCGRFSMPLSKPTCCSAYERTFTKSLRRV